MTVLSLRSLSRTTIRERNPVGGVEKVNYDVIPASERESRISVITLLWKLLTLMQIYLFNYSPIQTVIFILLPWILDRVEEDKRGGSVG